MIHVIREKVTPEQLREMLKVYSDDRYVKQAVDLEQEIITGGGVMHYECEQLLLEEAESKQRNVWGAGWYYERQETTFDSYINIRPSDGNRSIYLEDEQLKIRIRSLVEQFFGGVQP